MNLSNTEDLLAFVNEQANKIREAREAFNKATDDAELHFCEPRIPLETRVFALQCLVEYTKRNAA
jgi:hypothetical protein